MKLNKNITKIIESYQNTKITHIWINLFLFGSFMAMIFISACECAPEIKTPKIISPDDYSYALFVNAITDRENVSIESNDVPLLKGISYSGTEYLYQKIQAGDSYLRLLDEQSNTSLFNMPIGLNKFEHYTIIFYGYRNSAKALILSDSMSTDNPAFRFVHTSFDAGAYVFRLRAISNSIEESLSFLSFTELTNLTAGTYDLEILSPDLKNIILSKSLTIENGKIYSIILKGTDHTVPLKPLLIDIVSVSKDAQ
jgi:hypothetical protein